MTLSGFAGSPGLCGLLLTQYIKPDVDGTAKPRPADGNNIPVSTNSVVDSRILTISAGSGLSRTQEVDISRMLSGAGCNETEGYMQLIRLPRVIKD
jgi:hypothetical protein